MPFPHQRMAIGERLVAGPRCLVPPEGESRGWLEPATVIRVRQLDGSAVRSVGLYRDATVNRTHEELRRVIRVANWDRFQELERAAAELAGDTPLVRVGLGHVADVSACDRVLARLADLARDLPFACARVATPTERLFFTLATDDEHLEFETSLATDSGWSMALLRAMDDLASLSATFDPSGWSERIDWLPSFDAPGATLEFRYVDGSLRERRV